MPRKELLEKLFSTFADLHQLMAAEKQLALKGRDLHRSQLEILWMLSTAPHFTIGEIADQRHITSSAATQVVDGLVEQGWVSRHEDGQDRRRMVIALNERGKAQLIEAKKCLFEKFSDRLAGLTDTQLQQIVTHFEILLAELSNTSQTDIATKTKGQ